MQLSSMKNKTSFATPVNIVLPTVRAQSSSDFIVIYQVGLNSSRSAVQKKIIVNHVEQSLLALKNNENAMQNKQGEEKRKVETV